MSDDTEARWNAKTAPAGVIATPARSVFDGAEPRFDELSELGRGGMGRVAEARDRALDRTVAIKHMLASDGTGLARFEREVRITARLQHPGVVPVLDAGRDADGHPYYVMRKIDGVPLADRVTRRSVRDRLALIPAMLAAVDAVAYAHAQGIVHRDIKPWNILLGSFGEALMIDWGLARDLAAPQSPDSIEPTNHRDAALTRLGSAYGTPGFMAPEQARGEAADRRADVYSLGATLYFVLAGASPFAGVEPTIAVDKVAAGDMPDMAKIPAEVPVELVAIVAKALAPGRDARYPDAGELADDLRRFVNGQLVAAHRYTAWERIAKWVRKHRLVTAISIAAIAVITIGAVWSISRIVDERDHARDAQALAETRADDLVVDRARSLVETDPTSAVAALRALPTSSPQWPVAREIVRAAMAGGIERMIAHHTRRVTALGFSPHGRLASSALASGQGGGTIQIHDVVRGTSTVIPAAGAGGLGWLDDRIVVVWDHGADSLDTLKLVDADTSTITRVTVGAFDTVAIDRGRAVVHRSDGGVVSVGGDGVIAELAASGIDAIDAKAGRIVMVNRKQMTIIDADGTRHERAVTIPTKIFRVALSYSGKRVAVHAYRMAYEWVADRDDPPASWPRASDAENTVLYVGDRLYSWSADGTGVAELMPDRIVSRWLTEPSGSTGLVPAGTAAATLFVTKGGRIAYANDIGVVELPHRPESVARIAHDASGQRLAIGTDEGDVEVVELATAIPETRTLLEGIHLYAIGNDRMVYGHETTNAGDFNVLDRLEIVELTTNKHHWFPPVGEFAAVAIRSDAIVALGGTANNRSIVVSDLDGNLRYRHDHIASDSMIDHVIFATEANELVELDAAWQPHVLARPEAKMFRIDETSAGIIVSTMAPGNEAYLVDATGLHPLVFPTLHQPANSFHRSADGTWWIVENFQKLWRISPSGAATEIPVRQDIRQLKSFGDHIYANGRSAIFELAPDGRIIRSTSSVGLSSYFDDGYVLATDTGVVVVMPAANVRRTLRIGGKPNHVRTTRDARMVAASLPGPGDHGDVVAIWRDPVPVDPAEIPAFIGRLTNARLDPGSDELRWDAP